MNDQPPGPEGRGVTVTLGANDLVDLEDLCALLGYGYDRDGERDQHIEVEVCLGKAQAYRRVSNALLALDLPESGEGCVVEDGPREPRRPDYETTRKGLEARVRVGEGSNLMDAALRETVERAEWLEAEVTRLEKRLDQMTVDLEDAHGRFNVERHRTEELEQERDQLKHELADVLKERNDLETERDRLAQRPEPDCGQDGPTCVYVPGGCLKHERLWRANALERLDRLAAQLEPLRMTEAVLATLHEAADACLGLHVPEDGSTPQAEDLALALDDAEQAAKAHDDRLWNEAIEAACMATCDLHKEGMTEEVACEARCDAMRALKRRGHTTVGQRAANLERLVVELVGLLCEYAQVHCRPCLRGEHEQCCNSMGCEGCGDCPDQPLDEELWPVADAVRRARRAVGAAKGE